MIQFLFTYCMRLQSSPSLSCTGCLLFCFTYKSNLSSSLFFSSLIEDFLMFLYDLSLLLISFHADVVALWYMGISVPPRRGCVACNTFLSYSAAFCSSLCFTLNLDSSSPEGGFRPSFCRDSKIKLWWGPINLTRAYFFSGSVNLKSVTLPCFYLIYKKD